jgi:hypothetical protein
MWYRPQIWRHRRHALSAYSGVPSSKSVIVETFPAITRSAPSSARREHHRHGLRGQAVDRVAVPLDY